MINVKKYFKENEFQSLSYVIIAWMVIDMLSGMLMVFDNAIFYLTVGLGAVCVCLYGIKTASLKKRFKGFAVVGTMCILGGILNLLLWFDGAGSRYVSLAIAFGSLPILADLIFGTGMERVVKSVSRRLKRAWMIWKCIGVIVGIFAPYSIYKLFTVKIRYGGIRGDLGCGQIDWGDFDVKANQLCFAFLAFWVFRIIQAVLTLITAKVMKKQEGECVVESEDETDPTGE